MEAYDELAYENDKLAYGKDKRVPLQTRHREGQVDFEDVRPQGAGQQHPAGVAYVEKQSTFDDVSN